MNLVINVTGAPGLKKYIVSKFLNRALKVISTLWTKIELKVATVKKFFFS